MGWTDLAQDRDGWGGGTSILDNEPSCSIKYGEFID